MLIARCIGIVQWQYGTIATTTTTTSIGTSRTTVHCKCIIRTRRDSIPYGSCEGRGSKGIAGTVVVVVAITTTAIASAIGILEDVSTRR